MKVEIDMNPTQAIQAKAKALGFDVVSIGGPVDKRDALNVWLTKGYHGTMKWMAEKADVRGSATHMWPDVNSVIVVGMNYGPKEDPRPLLKEKDKGYISIYARADDYHEVLKKRLKALGRYMAEEFGAELKVFVDTAPVMEKPLAQEAGLGWQGKHTCVVSREFGSWLFLGVVYTSLKLEKSAPERDHCGRCNACQVACPTQAFEKPYVLDARKCISYLTIEHDGPIPHEFRKQMGNRIYGCDDCLAACPWNKFAQESQHIAFHHRAESVSPNLADLAQLDDAAFRARFRKSPIKRIKRDKFVRNVLIAIGNSEDKTFLPIVEKLTTDANEMVAEAAQWARKELHNAS